MPDAPTKPRRKNVVKVSLTDEQMAMAVVLDIYPEQLVAAAMEGHTAALREKFQGLKASA